jgi:hypothetical protein
MTRSRPLHLGLALGCLAGLVVSGARVVHRARRVMEFLPAYRRVAAVAAWPHSRAFAPNGTELQPPQPLTPRLRLVGQDRRGLHLPRADYNKMWLERVDFRRADLREADFRDAWIRGCDFRGANLKHADLTGATFDPLTRWPTGFDPVAHGADPWGFPSH